jgi:uncharacterized protein YecE (DUF72 family)
MKIRRLASLLFEAFDTVEVDSTFYRCPTVEAVRNWGLKTPPGFIFSLKIPRTIAHEIVLVECDKEFEELLARYKYSARNWI